ncbi:MAG: 16S rRNA (cytosine(967)-C(5))-methyltransferase RsmB [Candidatus Latescibacterota bacterium]
MVRQDSGSEHRLVRRRNPEPARLVALHCLHRVETSGAPLDSLLEDLDRSLEPRDRRLARHLVLGCLRWQKRLDWIAAAYCSRPAEALEAWARLVLRMGLYQLLWMSRIPAHAAVHSAVELARQLAHEGIARMVNAVLRRVQREGDRVAYPDPRRDPVAHLAVWYSHPEWLVARWLARWRYEQTERLLQADNEEAPVYIRLNPLRTTAEELVRALAEEGYQLEPAGPLPGAFRVVEPEGVFASRAHAGGLFIVQDVNAGLAAALLAPPAGSRVADLCSAPGGKTMQLAMAMGDEGLVLAGDLHPERLARVREHAVRLGLRSVRCLGQDARAAGVRPAFSHVLADVPCSGTGTLARRPDARWRRDPAQLAGLVARQGQILQAAYDLVLPGGVVTYSTCSLEEEENLQVVGSFLARTPGARLDPARRWFRGQVWAEECIQTLPGREPGDGSFAARIRRPAR